jgi:hypothetical protein
LKLNQNGGQNSGNHNNFQKNSSNGAYCTYCSQPGQIESNGFKLKNKFTQNSGTNSNDGQGHRFLIPMMLQLQQSPQKIIFQVTCGFLIVEQVVTTASPWKG